ncbi:MAG: primosomal protein N' [Bacteroidales bacterium]|jgi:primosomal protein N' (replication factor Y)|nr:primosomal protein N' [Bacteroidales bacterium]
MTKETKYYADVILPLAVNNIFTYQIPDDIDADNLPGSRVIVQFGAKKRYSAIVWAVHTNQPKYRTKLIDGVVDNFPVINSSQRKFWTWISAYYMCTLGEVFKAAIPAGLKLESITEIYLSENDFKLSELTDDERVIYNYLLSTRRCLLKDLEEFFSKNKVSSLIKTLVKKGVVELKERINGNYNPTMITYLSVNPEYDLEDTSLMFDKLKRAAKQQVALTGLIDIIQKEDCEFVEKSRLMFETKSTTAVINALVDKDIINVHKFEPGKVTGKESGHVLNELSEAQNRSYEEIVNQFNEGKVTLLKGVTGSGKTEIYIHLIQQAISEGKQVLYLLPEIALTTQIITRLKSAFGEKIGVYHSRYTDKERADLYLRQLDSERALPVIVGARSAVFLPFNNLGLVIVDEEHEPSFKQYDPAPRYNGRDASVVLASLFEANTLLGSATPSIESFFNAKTGKYGLVELNERHSKVKMPDVVLVNTLKERRRKRMFSLFSGTLLDNMEKAISDGEQVILFQNRRGFSSYVECGLCAEVPQCPHCNVSLTYHKSFNNLMCHYCGYTIKLMPKCPKCYSGAMETRGFGTEMIEDELAVYLPDARVARMDLDSTRRKNAFSELIDKFQSHQIDILVGTQMVTKGLDFDNVSVVGVLNSDSMLRFPDFRAFERSYHLLTQVAGRAGRKREGAKVYIQSSDTEHPVLADVQDGNYARMFVNQCTERKMFHYPPYVRLVKLNVKHKNKGVLRSAANEIVNRLRKRLGTRVLGPVEPIIDKIQSYNIMEIIVKLDGRLPHSKVKVFINQTIDEVCMLTHYKSVIVVKDVDPA